jgi:hypothetical protein
MLDFFFSWTAKNRAKQLTDEYNAVVAAQAEAFREVMRPFQDAGQRAFAAYRTESSKKA